MASTDENQDLFRLFRYTPNLGAAALFTILFMIFAIIHTYQVLVTRTWFFTAFVVGSFFEAVGFLVRCICAEESPNWTIASYSVHTILVLVAPSVFAASIYMILGRIILLTDGEAHALVKRRWLTKIFVTGDVFAFVLQGAGGGTMASGTLSAITTGENIIIAGLVIQICFFSCFVVVAGTFHWQLLRIPTTKILAEPVPWRKHLYALYAGSILTWIRCVFRLIEYAQGNDGYLISHEAFLYIFDATLMFGVMVLFAIIHPSEIMALIKREGAKRVEKGFQLSAVH